MISYIRYVYLIAIATWMSSCTPKIQHVATVKERSIQLENENQSVDPGVVDLIKPYKAKLDLTMNDVISYNEVELTKGKPNSGLTNWVADALLEEARRLTTPEVDFAVLNYGGVRIQSLAKGDVTVGKMYELMPFDNVLYIAQLDSVAIMSLAQKILKANGWPLSHTIEIKGEFGEVVDIKVQGQPLTSKRIYQVAIPDFVFNGGDGMDMFKGAKYNNTGAFIRDLFIAYLKNLKAQKKTIQANMQPRMQ
jgi:2',3'-cyclic-nucleotide 2'-phosphodiesterase (5'-nucleotidase family)